MKLRHFQTKKNKSKLPPTDPPLKIIKTRGCVSSRKELSPKRKEIQEGMVRGRKKWHMGKSKNTSTT